ncbi:MAG: SagB/ThcOx family dehydrogenase [Promethearchaeota archaeon]
MSKRYGADFLRKSKYVRGKLPHGMPPFMMQVEPYKAISDCSLRIKLPRKHEFRTVDFMKILQSRRSRRKFTRIPMTIQEISTVLKFTSGPISDEFQPSIFNRRHVPSAGGLYPYETYVAINNVEDVQEGLYHYNVLEHSLDLLKKGDFRERLSAAALNQGMVASAAAVLLWAAIASRSEWKYLQRCYRYIFLDLGHLGQNFYLVSEALNLGCCTIGAFYDDELNDIVGIDGLDETVCYMGVVGHVKGN